MTTVKSDDYSDDLLAEAEAELSKEVSEEPTKHKRMTPAEFWQAKLFWGLGAKELRAPRA